MRPLPPLSGLSIFARAEEVAARLSATCEAASHLLSSRCRREKAEKTCQRRPFSYSAGHLLAGDPGVGFAAASSTRGRGEKSESQPGRSAKKKKKSGRCGEKNATGRGAGREEKQAQLQKAEAKRCPGNSDYPPTENCGKARPLFRTEFTIEWVTARGANVLGKRGGAPGQLRRADLHRLAPLEEKGRAVLQRRRATHGVPSYEGGGTGDGEKKNASRGRGCPGAGKAASWIAS